ncbi:unnamed protein product [Rotaria sp. Silwood1]|nr:unnamed protein product [Rotaria sp. Silwood1]CAF1633428.1 unnamed protein product [Rotaria sp. Silwood1]CAF3777703.1 unnamed protein product [Rotaria sp. Silwood1]CAF4668959.1 unnamed protein product [Rotaria sp. Silwood1]CAF4684408.1 unnamed protein product [Rotaria sp. Silwood1]
MLNEQFNLNNVRRQKDNLSNGDKFFDILGRINKFLDYTLSKPMEIYDDIVNNIYELLTNSPDMCAMCTCIVITTTISVTSIAVGVGIGVGVGCAP